MKYLQQFAIILICLGIGNMLSIPLAYLIAIPGPIVGMIVLFIALKTGIIKLEHIDELSTFMFSIIALFFLPSGISLMNYLDLIVANFVPIVFVGVGVTIVALAMTMKCVDVMVSFKKKGDDVHD